MKIREVKQVEPSKTPHNVDVRQIYDTDSAQAVHITLQAGESLKPHITPVDVFFYVLEGTPVPPPKQDCYKIISINDKKIRL